MKFYFYTQKLILRNLFCVGKIIFTHFNTNGEDGTLYPKMGSPARPRTASSMSFNANGEDGTLHGAPARPKTAKVLILVKIPEIMLFS